jgi:uncharacterized iron-regulated membrane protein
MDPTVVAPIWQKSAEFGVLAFLLVLILLGVAWVGYKLTTWAADSMVRQAEAGERTADGLQETNKEIAQIKSVLLSIQKHAATTSVRARSMQRAHRYSLDAITELAGEGAAPRLKESLRMARHALDREDT